MLSKLSISEVVKPRRQTLVMCNWVIQKCLSCRSESPEIPNWFKSPQVERCWAADLEDDFVLPSTSGNDLVGNRDGMNVKYVCNDGGRDSDVDKVSRILKTGLGTPEAVIGALDGCSVVVSESLVDKVLKRFCNDWVPAFGFFKWVEMQMDHKHSAGSYDSMVDILGKSKQFDIMWDFLKEMNELGGLISLKTMSKVMRRICRAGRSIDSIKTFHDIEKFGLSKDTSTINILLDALCKERCVENAYSVFLEFKNEIPPNSQTYNILIHGWCKARKLDNAWGVMKEMEKNMFQPCVISYTSLIEAYCYEKDFRRVDAILVEMSAKGCPPNVVTYTIAMHSFGKANETGRALEVYDKMKKSGCVPDTSFYNSLIYILSKVGRLRDIRKLYEEMFKIGTLPNITTYNTMISTACKHSQEKSALDLLREMEEKFCEPDLKTYAPLLKMCCRKKWVKVLFYLLDDMFKKNLSIELGTYTLLVLRLCKSGKLDQACLFFEEMVSKGLVPRSSTCKALVEELERNMEKEKERIHQLTVEADSSCTKTSNR